MRKILIVALVLISNCLPLAHPVPKALASPETQAIEQALFYLVNSERTAHGLPALTPNPLLAQAAEKKARDMMAGGYFEHTDPTGREFYLWIDETGYRYSIAGENLAANINMISPEKMVESWMSSTLHRDNILSGKYSETGLGVAQGIFQGQETVFAVQTFGHPLEESQKLLELRPLHRVEAPSTSVPTSEIITTSSTPMSVTEEELVAGVSVTTSSVSKTSEPITKNKLVSFIQKLREFFLNLF